MNRRSVNFYLAVIFSVVVILKFIGILSIRWPEIFSFAAIFWGMNIFYNSYLKLLPTGIFIGALLFQIGILLFLTSKYELYEPRRVFIPALMSVIGFSLLFTNLIQHSNKYRFFLSILISLVGILLIFFRSSVNLDLYFSYLLEIINYFWIVIVFLVIIIALTIFEFNRENKNQN